MLLAKTTKLLLLASLGLSLAACSFPKRDYSMLPNADVIKVQLKDGRWVAIPPECNSMFNEPARTIYDSRPQVPYGCATYTNLANSVANPRDLVEPAAYGGQHADTADSAVTRYREGQITPLKETTTTSQ